MSDLFEAAGLAQAAVFNHLMGSPDGLSRRHARKLACVGHELDGRHPRNVAVLFWHVADYLANLHGLGGNVEPKNPAAASSRLKEAQKSLEQGGLASAVGPQESNAAFWQIEADALKSFEPAEPNCQALN